MTYRYARALLDSNFLALLLLAIAGSTLSCPVAHVGAVDDIPRTAEAVDVPAVDGEDVEDEADTEEAEEGSDATGADATYRDLWDELRLGRLVPLETGPMAGFFKALSDIENKRTKSLVRVLHYGDSHTAADVLPSAIRRALQKRFGSGGRGFVYLGKPWRTYRPADVETGVKGDWDTRRIFLGKDPATMDGRYGLGGVAVDSSQPGAQVSLATDSGTYFGNKASTFEVFFLKQPKGGSFTVYVDDRKHKVVSTASKTLRTGFFKIALKEKPHRIELNLNGDGRVRLFGAAVERKGPGVVYDVLGINGAFFYTPLRWDASLLAEQVERRAPHLVATMYGANEADSKSLTEERYLTQVKQALERIRAGAGDASCLLLGPMDRVVPQADEEEDRLDVINRVQQEAADEVGCAFIDLRELMGGAGSYELWQSKGLAQGDGVHLTVAGYRILGEMIARRLLDTYQRYLEESLDLRKKRDRRSGETPSGKKK